MNCESLEEQLNILSDNATQQYVEAEIKCGVSLHLSREGKANLLSYLEKGDYSYYIIDIVRKDIFNQIKENERNKYKRNFITEHNEMIKTLNSIGGQS